MDFVIGVPFSGCDKYVKDYLIAPREDVAMAMAYGAMLAGRKTLVFMQNSGLGLCVDVITSLIKPSGIEIPLLIYNRRTPDHHSRMGKISEKLLELLEYVDYQLIEES